MIFSKIMRIILVFVIILMVFNGDGSGNAYAKETQKEFVYKGQDKDPRLDWFKNAKFGMMVHWGLYSEPGGIWKGKDIRRDYSEWLMNYAQIPIKEYEKLASEFNPVKFNAEEWMSLAASAGMKYLVITAKHHDGFAMFKSAADPYNIVDATPFARDPMKELAEACKKRGIKICFYYSQSLDWHYPGGAGNDWDPAAKGDFQKYLNKKAIPQITELLSNYGPVGIIWLDIAGAMKKPQQSKAIKEMILELQPGCLASSRLGYGYGDFEELGDNYMPTKVIKHPWETTATLNDAYGYKKTDKRWKTPRTIIRSLVHVVSRGGCYLLNVGPTAEGLIPTEPVRIIQDVANWMDKYSESIHDTTADPFGDLPWGRCTAKPGKLYLHVFDFPPDGQLFVPGLKNKVKNAYLLADPKKTKLAVTRLTKRDTSVSIPAIKLPPQAFHPDDTVIVLEIEGKADVDTTKVVVSKNYDNVFQAYTAKIHGQKAKYFRTEYHSRVNSHIADFSDPQEWVSWDFRTIKSGSFNLEITYAAPDTFASNEYQVTISKKGSCTKEAVIAQFNTMVQDTGGYTIDFTRMFNLYQYKKFKLGFLHIAQPGDYTLSIKPLTIAKTPLELMYLNSVSLVPSL